MGEKYFEGMPTLRTERLVLRGHRREDLGDCAAMWADPEVTRYLGGRPFSEEEVWGRLLRYVGHWAIMGFGDSGARLRSIRRRGTLR